MDSVSPAAGGAAGQQRVVTEAISIFFSTWDLGHQQPSVTPSWIPHPQAEPFDLYVIALQHTDFPSLGAPPPRMAVHRQSITGKLVSDHHATNLIRRHVGSDYRTVAEVCYKETLRLLVLVHHAHVSRAMQAADVLTATTGSGDAHDARAACAVTLKFHDTSMCFAAANLPRDGLASTAARCDALSGLLADVRPILGAQLDIPHNYDCMVLLGALNFQLNLSRDQVVAAVEAQAWDALAAAEELQRVMDPRVAERAFGCGLHEVACTYPPTYRVLKTKKIEYHSRTTPMYADRLLWRAGPGVRLMLEHTHAVPEASCCESKPLVAYINVETWRTLLARDRVYRVRPDDTLHTISERFGVDTRVLQRVNGLRNNMQLLVDHPIIIPPTQVDASVALPSVELAALSCENLGSGALVDACVQFIAPWIDSREPLATPLIRKKLNPVWRQRDLPVLPLRRSEEFLEPAGLQRHWLALRVLRSQPSASAQDIGIAVIPLRDLATCASQRFDVPLSLHSQSAGRIRGVLKLLWPLTGEVPAAWRELQTPTSRGAMAASAPVFLGVQREGGAGTGGTAAALGASVAAMTAFERVAGQRAVCFKRGKTLRQLTPCFVELEPGCAVMFRSETDSQPRARMQLSLELGSAQLQIEDVTEERARGLRKSCCCGLKVRNIPRFDSRGQRVAGKARSFYVLLPAPEKLHDWRCSVMVAAGLAFRLCLRDAFGDDPQQPAYALPSQAVRCVRHVSELLCAGFLSGARDIFHRPAPDPDSLVALYDAYATEYEPDVGGLDAHTLAGALCKALDACGHVRPLIDRAIFIFDYRRAPTPDTLLRFRAILQSLPATQQAVLRDTFAALVAALEDGSTCTTSARLAACIAPHLCTLVPPGGALTVELRGDSAAWAHAVVQAMLEHFDVVFAGVMAGDDVERPPEPQASTWLPTALKTKALSRRASVRASRRLSLSSPASPGTAAAAAAASTGNASSSFGPATPSPLRHITGRLGLGGGDSAEKLSRRAEEAAQQERDDAAPPTSAAPAAPATSGAGAPQDASPLPQWRVSSSASLQDEPSAPAPASAPAPSGLLRRMRVWRSRAAQRAQAAPAPAASTARLGSAAPGSDAVPRQLTFDLVAPGAADAATARETTAALVTTLLGALHEEQRVYPAQVRSGAALALPASRGRLAPVQALGSTTATEEERMWRALLVLRQQLPPHLTRVESRTPPRAPQPQQQATHSALLSGGADAQASAALPKDALAAQPFVWRADGPAQRRLQPMTRTLALALPSGLAARVEVVGARSLHDNVAEALQAHPRMTPADHLACATAIRDALSHMRLQALAGAMAELQTSARQWPQRQAVLQAERAEHERILREIEATGERARARARTRLGSVDSGGTDSPALRPAAAPQASAAPAAAPQASAAPAAGGDGGGDAPAREEDGTCAVM